MDKSLETLYHKLTNLLNINPSTNPSSSTTESSTLLPISTFFDRLIPSSTTVSHNNDRNRSPSRLSRQIPIQENDNPFPPYTSSPHIPQAIPINKIKQQ